jgi:hypothetical protein
VTEPLEEFGVVPKSNAARAENRPLDVAPATEQPETKVWPDAAPDGAFGSPARQLQLELQRSWAAEEPGKRWSARRSFAFIAFSSGLLWVALIWGASRIV